MSASALRRTPTGLPTYLTPQRPSTLKTVRFEQWQHSFGAPTPPTTLLVPLLVHLIIVLTFMTSKLSGLQREVLALYRSILRESIRKDRKKVVVPMQPSHHRPVNALLYFSSNTTTSYAREQFRKESSTVRRADFKTIEYMIRKGRKQLQLLKMPGVDVVRGAWKIVKLGGRMVVLVYRLLSFVDNCQKWQRRSHTSYNNTHTAWVPINDTFLQQLLDWFKI